MSNLNLQTLKQAIEKSWSAETSSQKEWSTSNPTLGQCTVTACVLQDYLGGDIVNSIATLPSGEQISHYLNLIDGRHIDLTSQQFPAGTTFSKPEPKTKQFSSTREYCLSYENTKKRYEILKDKVAKYISKISKQ